MTAPATSERTADRWAMCWIVAATVLAYGLCLGGAFVYDDVHSVRDNPAVASLRNIPRYFVDVDLFSSLEMRMYRPILLTSFAIDGFIGGMRPWAFKATNLLLHAGTGCLVFAIARHYGVSRGRAGLAAVLLGVHPMAAEAVNTISGRSNVMMVAALLAAVRCHFAAMAGSRRAVLGTAVFGIVAVGCKEPGIILPVLLVIVEGLRRAQGGAAAPRRTVVARLAPSVVIAVIYLLVRSHFLGAATAGMAQWQGTDATSGHSRGMATQLASMALVLPRALLQVVVPHGMTMDPEVPYTGDVLAPAVLASAAGLVALTVAGLWAPRRRPAVFLGTCFAWGTALPWVLKPLNLPFLEHRFYGALVGLALAGGALLPRIEWAALRLPARIGIGCAVAVCVFLSGARSLEFTSEKRLWTVELERNPESQVARAGMAVCLMQERRFAASRPFLESVVAAYPNRRDARLNLAEVALHTGDPELALEQSSFLIRHWPQNPFHCLLHSRALAAVGQRRGDAGFFDRAVAAALRANEIAAPKGLTYRTAAGARRLQGDLDAAIALLDEAVAAGLDHSSVLLDRHELLAAAGQHDAARRDLNRAVQQNPFDPRVLAALRKAGTAPAAPQR